MALSLCGFSIRAALGFSICFLTACSAPEPEAGDPTPAPEEVSGPQVDADGFVSIFNGEDLTGWTPKITGFPLGENHADTFVVENGVLRVRYDDYETFDGRFGHLFFERPFESYILRLEYRFVGKQVPGGPGWASMNSGVMLHAQSPESMVLDQQFPVSIEAQMLGQFVENVNPRPTGNLCTPGTYVVMEGSENRRHCINSKSETYRGEQWVSMEVEVHGHGKIIHRIEGGTVMEYEQATLDPGDGRDGGAAARVVDARSGDVVLRGGYFALQAESHPVEFRNIRIKELEE